MNNYSNTINEIYNYLNKEYNKAILNPDNSTGFVNNMKTYKSSLENIILQISKITPPEDMLDFNRYQTEKFNKAYEQILHCINSIENNSNESIRQFNLLTQQINLLTEQANQELTKVFDKNDIKYEINNNQIHYWINN